MAEIVFPLATFKAAKVSALSPNTKEVITPIPGNVIVVYSLSCAGLSLAGVAAQAVSFVSTAS
jgi:hypothetical protein